MGALLLGGAEGHLHGEPPVGVATGRLTEGDGALEERCVNLSASAGSCAGLSNVDPRRRPAYSDFVRVNFLSTQTRNHS